MDCYLIELGNSKKQRDRKGSLIGFDLATMVCKGILDAGFLCGLLEGKLLSECGRIATPVGTLSTAAFDPMEWKISPDSVQELMSR